jgi:hypothetical protein
MVVTAEGNEMPYGGWSTLRPGDAMVKVAFDCRHATSGEDTGLVMCLDMAALAGGGPPAGDPIVGHRSTVRVSDGVSPLAVMLGCCDLAGDVGNHRAVSGKLTRILGQPGQSGQIYMNVDHPTMPAAAVVGSAFEEV